ncbi:hypothetical protein UFOVP530_29 [uncultured Caudovirales phage]|uniref:Uncharacterized protein n=1 Tax=uncultured Caudovirales phage TaxID=2100421 RepID=A0A6J5SXS3_9CAUD|nr:hypothetical protein UFOVP530_29 [uncultured Caudovirales phage]CAB4179025.1 hypothetical protein UFOVP1027_29 [uncultured Caudovirales phage]CAB4188591.1 hypothetical protein UFOVP1182_47 [uncultured Caudovirales phage]CAB4220392.1 hypothetical protein UFOVP1632_11 [uncultured Caudovirales phage]
MIEKQINIVVSTKGNEKAEANIEKLNASVKNLNQTNKEGVKDQKNFGNAILDNGGAMGLLNDVTGGLAMTVKDAAEATALFSKEGKIMSAVNKGIAYTQGLWNAAMAANPSGLLVAAIATVIAAGYLLIKFFMDSAAANELAMNATKKHTKELENQTAKATQSSEALKVKNNQLLALAKASGASAEEIRRLTLQYANEEVAVNRANAVIASNTFIRERNTLAVLKAKGVSEEAIAAQEKLTQATYKDLQNANKILQGSYDKRRDIINSAEVEILQSKTDATKKANEDAKAKAAENAKILKEAREKANAERIADEQNFAKILRDKQIEQGSIAQDDAENARKENEERLLTTQELAIQKENEAFLIKKERAIAQGLETQDLETQHLNRLNDINLEAQQIDYDNKKKASDKELNDAKIVAENKESLLKSNLSNINTILNVGGKKFAKIQKALAIAEIVRDTIRAVNAATGNEIKVPAFIGTIPNPVKPASLISTITGIGAVLAKSAASIVAITSDSSSTSGGGATSSSLGGGGGGAPAPSFNLVQGTGSNQIAQGLATERRPVQAYVVASQMTTAQSLERNIIDRATL